jgi:hypothetical protein
MMTGRVMAAGVLVLLCARPAAAQRTTGAARANGQARIELSGGGGLFGGGDLGARDANLRANGTSPQPYRLFATTSTLAAAPIIEGRVAVALTGRLGAEARFGYSQPELRTSVTSDAEGAPALTVVERIDQYAIDGGVVVRIDEWRVAGLTPFLTAGVGYLRQLHTGQTLVEEGHSYHLGGGMRRSLFVRSGRVVSTAGIRADVRVDVLSSSLALDGRQKAHGSITGAFFVGF